jgi:hypothetical protein
VGTQALQVIESINYLLDCHAGGRGFESRPLLQESLVYSDPTQLQLAERLGISVGGLNYCLKALREKGLVKM